MEQENLFCAILLLPCFMSFAILTKAIISVRRNRKCEPWYRIVTEGNSSRVDGAMYTPTEFIIRLMKIRPILVDAGPCDYGRLLGPNNWSGVMGYFQRKSVDVSMDAFEANEDFLQVVGFGNGADMLGSSILSGPSNRSHEQFESLVAAVNWKIWIMMFFSLASVSLVSFLMAKIAKHYLENTNIIIFPKKQFISHLLKYFGLLWKKGTHFNTPTNAQRILLSSWLMFTIILTTLLEASFVSKLSVVDIPVRIDSLTDVIKFPQKAWMAVSLLNTEMYLQSSEAPQIRNIWDRLVETGGNIDLTEFFTDKVMNQVAYGSALIIGEEKYILGSILEFYCLKHQRPYYIAKESFGIMPAVPYYRRDLETDIVEDFIKSFTSFVEQGFGDRILLDIQRHVEPCLKQKFLESQIQGETLRFKNLAKVFQLLLAGHLLACVVFVFEVLTILFTNG